MPGLVLVHGGAHAADCWELVVAELAQLAPELPVVAVDLPGRAARPADLSDVRICDWVDSVVTDVDDAGLGDVLVVGHSLAGVTVPGVVSKLGADRVREMILVAAFVPPQGKSVIKTLRGPLAPLSRAGVSIGRSFPMPPAAARLAFCNGMSREQRKLTLSRLYPESLNVIVEPVDRRDMPEAVPRTWIMTLSDRALSVRRQRQYIDALGGVATLICVDSCHDVMISKPKWLARVLLERCRLRSSASR
ncbi:esterase [Mycobacterium conspicuum]|nr:esterase [Mycobacterium conspicuum]